MIRKEGFIFDNYDGIVCEAVHCCCERNHNKKIIIIRWKTQEAMYWLHYGVIIIISFNLHYHMIIHACKMKS